MDLPMSELPLALFSNPVWHALHGPHRHLARIADGACRYPADVSPFAAIGGATNRAFDALRSLLAPQESVWIVDYGRTAPGLGVVENLECMQMVLRSEAELPGESQKVLPLTDSHADEMIALTDVAFPGFFRAGTCRMGSYCGVRMDGKLIAMGGERLRLQGYPELSAICTHPEHRGKGLATAVIAHLLRLHRRDGLRSWLHVGARNSHAMDLYEDLGFQRVRTLMLHRIVRTDQ
jgi:ribosomal protein S18 acetylase RimI-like enzyme